MSCYLIFYGERSEIVIFEILSGYNEVFQYLRADVWNELSNFVILKFLFS